MVTKLLIPILTVANLIMFRPISASGVTTENIFALTNRARRQHDLPELTFSTTLEVAALFKAQHMIDNDYFDHYGPTGSTPWQFIEQAGYDYQFGGENLAVGFTAAEEMVGAWLDSKTHRQNILDPNFMETGIAIVPVSIDGVPDVIVVQMFGKQTDSGNQTIAQYVNSLLGVNDASAASVGS